LIKNSDTCWTSLNAPLKWIPPITMITGAQYRAVDEGFVPIKLGQSYFCSGGQRISYWGAAGNRARNVFENRGTVFAYDMQQCQKFKDASMQASAAKYRIASWITADIYGAKEIPGDVFVSDIFMDSWNKRDGVDYHGHAFVSGLLSGKVTNGNVTTCDTMPPTRLVKGFVPEDEYFQLYEEAYPFIVWRVCRPNSRELIYMKVPDNVVPPRNKMLKALMYLFNTDFSTRFAIVHDRQEFEMFATKTMRHVVADINYHIRRMVVDPFIVSVSPEVRTWGIHRSDMPLLYAPKKFRYSNAEIADDMSGVFSALILGNDLDNVQEMEDQDAEIFADDADGDPPEQGEDEFKDAKEILLDE